MLSVSEQRTLAAVRAELDRLARYDEESLAHEVWVRQRYECGCYASYAPARAAAVRTAWHEAGHAVAALTVGATFSSASIRHGHRSAGGSARASAEGRVHGITRAGSDAFVIHAAGQIAERLRDWSLPGSDEDLRALLRTWKSDGGDARRFRQSIAVRYGTDEAGAWRHAEKVFRACRPQVRVLARALLVHPRHLTYNVAAALVTG